MGMKLPFDITVIPDFKTKLTVQEEALSSDIIQFSSKCNSFCVGIIDMVNSTAISALLSYPKISKFYSIFLNSMGFVVKSFGGKIVKNAGDSILYYFPQTCDAMNQHAIRESVECSLSMITAHDALNKKLLVHGIPPINYRVSMDYGNIIIAGSEGSSSEDIFGPTVNLCAKINSAAPQNSVVIGGDLYELAKRFPYNFKTVGAYFNGLKFAYPVYSVSLKKKTIQTHSYSYNLEDEFKIDA